MDTTTYCFPPAGWDINPIYYWMWPISLPQSTPGVSCIGRRVHASIWWYHSGYAEKDPLYWWHPPLWWWFGISIWHTVDYIIHCGKNEIFFHHYKFHFTENEVDSTGFLVMVEDMKPTKKNDRTYPSFLHPYKHHEQEVLVWICKPGYICIFTSQNNGPIPRSAANLGSEVLLGHNS